MGGANSGESSEDHVGRGVEIVRRWPENIAAAFLRDIFFRKKELVPKENPAKVWWRSRSWWSLWMRRHTGILEASHGLRSTVDVISSKTQCAILEIFPAPCSILLYLK